MSQAQKTRYVIGNWKMNLELNDAKALLNQVADRKTKLVHTMVAPSFVYLPMAQGIVGNDTLAAQNLASKTDGAYTGEVSAAMLGSMGIKYSIIGHSERRTMFGEDNADINAKLLLAQKNGITPILCVGDDIDAFDAGESFETVKAQLTQGLEGGVNTQNLIVAYEPVWAIGTGKAADATFIRTMHRQIHDFLQNGYSRAPSLLYGGSVKPENADEIASIDDVDGVLVGGAALSFDAFSAIIEAFDS